MNSEDHRPLGQSLLVITLAIGMATLLLGLVCLLVWYTKSHSPGQVTQLARPTLSAAQPYHVSDSEVVSDTANDSASSVKRVTFVTVENAADTVAGEIVIIEAYRRIGIEVTVKKYPGERALRLADSGQVDGEVQRIDAVKKLYPNLLQIRPAINYLEASVFTTTEDFVPVSWESLRPYSVGVIRGVKFAEMSTVGMNRHLVSDYGSLFKMLDQGRVNVAVTPRLNGHYHIRRAQLSAIREIGRPIMRFDLYHYLHEKHAGLVPRITSVLSEMEITGELETIRSHVSEVLLERAENGLPVRDHGEVTPYMNALKFNEMAE